MRNPRGMKLMAIAAVALLAACNGDASQEETAGTSGQVLPGSVSDDMLPYGTATSQPPLMAPDPVAGTSSKPASVVDGDTPVSNEPEAAATPAAPVEEAVATEAN